MKLNEIIYAEDNIPWYFDEMLWSKDPKIVYSMVDKYENEGKEDENTN